MPCLLQTKSEVLTPRKKKFLKLNALLTQLPIDNTTKPRSGAHKRDTETRSNCNRSMDRSRKSQTRKHRVFTISVLPSCVCREGLREEKGLPAMKQKHAVFSIESVGGQSSREFTPCFFPQSNQATLERLLEDIAWKRFDQYLDSNQAPTKRNP